MQQPTLEWQRRLALLGVAVLVLAAHAGALGGAFVYDDVQLIQENTYIKSFDNVGRVLTTDFWDTSAGEEGAETLANAYFRPLVTLSYMVDHAMWSGGAGGYHATNIVLHLLVVLLVYLLARRLLPRPWWAAAAVALLFGLHPSRGESVCWISGRTDVLMGLFAVASLLLFVRALARRQGRVAALAGGWLCAAAALLCKESAVGLVLAVPALDALVVSRGERARLLRHLRWCHLPLLAGGVVYLALRLGPGGAQVGGAGGAPLEVVPYLLNILETAGLYTAALAAPYSSSMQLGAYPGLRPPDIMMVALGAVAAAAWLAGLALAWRRRESAGPALAALGLLLLGAFLAPALNIIPLGLQVLAAERNLYLPLAGVALLLILPLARTARPSGAPRPVLAVALGLLALSWAGALFVRGLDFSDPVRFWRVELERSPDNPDVERKLAHVLDLRGQHASALALRLSAWGNLDRLEVDAPPVRVRLFVRVLERTVVDLGPHGAADKGSLVRLLAGLRQGSGKLKLKVGERAMTLDTGDKRVKRALAPYRAALLSLEGSLLSQLDEDSRALALLAEAVKLKPGRLELRMNLCLARLRALDSAGGRREAEAIKRLARSRGAAPPASLEPMVSKASDLIRRILRADWRGAKGPSQEALRLLVKLYRATGAAIRARGLLRDIIKVYPDDRVAWSSLAMDLADTGQKPAALKLLREARAHFGDEPGLLALERRISASAGSK